VVANIAEQTKKTKKAKRKIAGSGKNKKCRKKTNLRFPFSKINAAEHSLTAAGNRGIRGTSRRSPSVLKKSQDKILTKKLEPGNQNYFLLPVTGWHCRFIRLEAHWR